MLEKDFEILDKMYKTDIHLHLDGSLRPSTMIELAREDGIDMEIVLRGGVSKDIKQCTVQELRQSMEVGEDTSNLIGYLRKFEITLKFLQSKKNLKRVACELVEDLKEENVIYSEVRFGPHLHLENGLSLQEVVQSVCEGVKEGEGRHGVTANVILCVLRHMDVSCGFEVVDLASKFKQHGVVGIDISGDESSFPVTKYEEVLKVARNSGINITVHAGEAAGAYSVKNAIEMGAIRIGHGINAMQDPEVLELALSKEVVFEISFKSNLQTRVLEDFSKYPLKDFLQTGIKCTICTDNRLISGTTISEEIRLIDKCLDSVISVEDYMEMFETGIKAAYITEDEKASLLSKMRTKNGLVYQNREK